jgi:hypothetical protein
MLSAHRQAYIPLRARPKKEKIVINMELFQNPTRRGLVQLPKARPKTAKKVIMPSAAQVIS